MEGIKAQTKNGDVWSNNDDVWSNNDDVWSNNDDVWSNNDDVWSNRGLFEQNATMFDLDPVTFTRNIWGYLRLGPGTLDPGDLLTTKTRRTQSRSSKVKDPRSLIFYFYLFTFNFLLSAHPTFDFFRNASILIRILRKLGPSSGNSRSVPTSLTR